MIEKPIVLIGLFHQLLVEIGDQINLVLERVIHALEAYRAVFALFVLQHGLELLVMFPNLFFVENDGLLQRLR